MLTSPAVVPLRRIDCEHLSLEIYAEEGNKDEDPDLFTPSPVIWLFLYQQRKAILLPNDLDYHLAIYVDIKAFYKNIIAMK